MAQLSKDFKSKLYTYFIHKLGAFDYRHGWLKSTCPHCGKENKYGINLAYNRTNCFKCGEHPTAVQLVMDLEKLNTYHELTIFLNSFDVKPYDYKEEFVELKTQKVLNMPEGFNLIGSNLDTEIGKIAINYLKGRGFEIAKLRTLGWGYSDSGDLLGYIIIPFYDNGKLIYYNARRFIGSGPRYKNPNSNESGLGKSFILYNKDALYIYDKIYICEGAINATVLGEKAISSSGKAVSRYQINEILKSPVKRVNIILDTEIDAKLKAINLGLQLCHTKKVKVVILPTSKDVNDLGRAITLKYIRNTPYQTYNQLLTLKQQILNEESCQFTYTKDSSRRDN